MAGIDWGSAADWFAAIGTISACWIALKLARKAKAEQDAQREERSRNFAVLVRAEISTAQARTVGLRQLLATVARAGGVHQAANWPTITSTVGLLGLPIAERLIDKALDLDPSAVKSTCDTMAMIEQIKVLIDPAGAAPETIESTVAALRILAIGLQMQVNLAHDEIWRISKPVVAPPANEGREVPADERALYQGYISEKGLDVSRLFPVKIGTF